MWTTRSGLPITSRIGFTAANAAASPPTMIDSVPLMAPMSPPLTGASSIEPPSATRAVREPLRHRRHDAAAVDDDGAALHRAEDAVGPSSTCSTSGESGTIVMMRVTCRATSAGDFGANGARRHEIVDRPLAPAVDHDGVARLQKVLRHRPTHEAQPDESNRVCHGGEYSQASGCRLRATGPGIAGSLHSGAAKTLRRSDNRAVSPSRSLEPECTSSPSL